MTGDLAKGCIGIGNQDVVRCVQDVDQGQTDTKDGIDTMVQS